MNLLKRSLALDEQKNVESEFIAIQKEAEELLFEVANAKVVPESHKLEQLNKLSMAGAKLAYSQDCLGLQTEQMRNLINWCDHLDEPEMKNEFIKALAKNPLSAPW